MRRIMIMITAGALLLMAGCQQAGTTSQASSATSEVSSMTSSIIASSDVSQTSSAAESAARKAQATTASSAKSTVSKAVAARAAVVPESSVPAAPALSSVPSPKTIALNVPTTFSGGKLTFTSARVDYENKAFRLDYQLELESHNAPHPDSAQTKCVDSAGNVLKPGVFGESSASRPSSQYSGKGQLEFYSFTDPANISSITVTYKFKETDPVTVKIDLPGV